jgi:hypothetical protein
MRLEKVLNFALSYELAIINTYFKKRKEHYTTYKRGRNRSLIDYFKWKRQYKTVVSNRREFS